MDNHYKMFSCPPSLTRRKRPYGHVYSRMLWNATRNPVLALFVPNIIYPQTWDSSTMFTNHFAEEMKYKKNKIIIISIWGLCVDLERGVSGGGGVRTPPGKNSNLLKRKLNPLLTNTIIIIPWTSLPFLNFFFWIRTWVYSCKCWR